MQKNIIFGIRDQSITEETKNYIIEKLKKIESLTKGVENITVNIFQTKRHINDFKDLQLEILIKLPKVFVKVEGKGHNVNVIFDSVMPVLVKRLKRYAQNFETRWSKNIGWKEKELKKSMIVDDEPTDTFYEPHIKRKLLTDKPPMHPAEAVERMELLGHASYLFKNIKTNNYAMIYKREKGGYGLVEPKNDN